MIVATTQPWMMKRHFRSKQCNQCNLLLDNEDTSNIKTMTIIVACFWMMKNHQR